MSAGKTDINDIVGGCSDAAEQVDYDPTEEIRIGEP